VAGDGDEMTDATRSTTTTSTSTTTTDHCGAARGRLTSLAVSQLRTWYTI